MKDFGSLLVATRLLANPKTNPIRYSKVANDIGVSVSTLRAWAEGRGLPSSANLKRILRELDKQRFGPEFPALYDRLKKVWVEAKENPSQVPEFSYYLSVCFGLLEEDAGKDNVWTHRELATKLNVEIRVIRHWENNYTRPSSDKFRELVSVLAERASSAPARQLLDELIKAYEEPLGAGKKNDQTVSAKSSSGVAISSVEAGGNITIRRIEAEGGVSVSAEVEKEQISTSPRRRGRALFRVPRTMWSEVAEIAELRLSATDELTVAMRAALEKTMVGRGLKTEEFGVDPIGNKMRAILFGDETYFKIDPLSTETQTLTDQPLHWDWRVTPRREGRSTLTLRMSMVSSAAEIDAAIDAQALHQSISISVKSWATRPTRFVRDNWKWMLGSSGIGAVAAFYALFQ